MTGPRNRFTPPLRINVKWWRRAAALLLCAFTFTAARALEPADIVVLYNASSPNSLKVAQYYQQVRHIPAGHLIPVRCDIADNITEAAYRTFFVPQLLKQLAERKLKPDAPGAPGVKCIVTTYDIPLRILAYQPTPEELAEAAALQKQLDDICRQASSEIQALDRIAPVATAATATAPADSKITWRALATQAYLGAQGVSSRVEKLAEPARSQAIREFMQVQQRLAGLNGLVSSLKVPPDAPGADDAQRQLAQFRGEIHDLDQQFKALAKQRDSARMRREMIAVRGKMDGLFGQAAVIEDLIHYLQPQATESCLDNELALVFADQGYPRANWLQNPRSVEVYPVMQHLLQSSGDHPPQTVMVARIDGSSVEKTEQMIDTTLKIEKTGLEGKLYLDARGLHTQDGYGAFDADLRKAADWLKQHSTIDVVLDDNPALLLAKDAPDCALYCGWYSLHAYQDSAQWLPGAVGYHVASLEMMSLHDPHETGWVVNLLNRGFCGTLGATEEPYLNAFPKPSLFFPLLLSGEFTQGEVWEVTAPCLSWRIGYVGDPLYNPYKAHPRVKVADLLEHSLLRNAYPALGKKMPDHP